MAFPLFVVCTLAGLCAPGLELAAAADSTRPPSRRPDAEARVPFVPGVAMKYPSRLDLMRELAAEDHHRQPPERDEMPSGR